MSSNKSNRGGGRGVGSGLARETFERKYESLLRDKSSALSLAIPAMCTTEREHPRSASKSEEGALTLWGL